MQSRARLVLLALLALASLASGEPEEADPNEVDLCILQLELGAYKINQTWTEDACGQFCRCAFRSEPRHVLLDMRVEPTVNMRPNSEQTEIRCGPPAKCFPFSIDCPNPRLLYPGGDSEDKCTCPRSICDSSITFTTTTELPLPTTTAATTAASATSTTPASVEFDSSLVAASTPTNSSATEQPVGGSDTETDTPSASSQPMSNREQGSLCSWWRSVPEGQPVPLIACHPLVDYVQIQINRSLQLRVWMLLAFLALMVTLFAIVTCMYLRRSSRATASISSQPAFNPTFTKLVGYNKAHVLLMDESNQNFANDSILIKQKNLEVDKTSPLHKPQVYQNPLAHQDQEDELYHRNGRQHLI